MRLLDNITRIIKEKQLNVFDLFLYQDSESAVDTVISAAPCQNCYSISKNVTALAVGIAQDMGLLKLQDTMLAYFEKELPDSYDKKLEQVTIEHLLTMTMGRDKGYLFESDRYAYPEKNWVRLVLSTKLDYRPGSHFTYSNANYYMLSCIIRRASGMPLQDFARRYIFDKMGIDSFAWEQCPCGEAMGATGLFLSSLDMGKLGVLCLNGGKYCDQRIVPEEYLIKATQNQVGTVKRAPEYGYSFWINAPYGYSGNGAHAQSLIVMPEKNLVFAAHAYADNIDYYDILHCAIQ